CDGNINSPRTKVGTSHAFSSALVSSQRFVRGVRFDRLSSSQATTLATSRCNAGSSLSKMSQAPQAIVPVHMPDCQLTGLNGSAAPHCLPSVHFCVPVTCVAVR